MQEGNSERPSWLPDKFKDPEQMAQAYSELERKLGNGNTDNETIGENKPNNNVLPDEDEVSGADGDGDLQGEQPNETTDPDEQVPSTISFDKYAQEIAEHGELTGDSYQELAKQGFSKDVVDTYIAGQKAIAESQNQKFQEAIGNNDMDKMVAWANQNYTPEQQDKYNKRVESGDTDQVLFALEKLRNDYEKSNGTHTPPIQGSGGGVSGDVYTSFQQFIADQSKPEYRSDPAYRQRIVEKLARSKV